MVRGARGGRLDSRGASNRSDRGGNEGRGWSEWDGEGVGSE